VCIFPPTPTFEPPSIPLFWPWMYDEHWLAVLHCLVRLLKSFRSASLTFITSCSNPSNVHPFLECPIPEFLDIPRIGYGVHEKSSDPIRLQNFISVFRTTLLCTRGVRTQVFSIPTPVLIQELGILIRILFATQIRILKKSC